MPRWEIARGRPFFEGDTLNVHGRGGAVIVFQIQAAGVFQDISARSLLFELDGETAIALTPGADDTQQLITIPESLVRAMSVGEAVNFAVLDITGEPVVALWTGQLRPYGFNGTPPA
jgi:hypothetical protein